MGIDGGNGGEVRVGAEAMVARERTNGRCGGGRARRGFWVHVGRGGGGGRLDYKQTVALSDGRIIDKIYRAS